MASFILCLTPDLAFPLKPELNLELDDNKEKLTKLNVLKTSLLFTISGCIIEPGKNPQ